MGMLRCCGGCPLLCTPLRGRVGPFDTGVGLGGVIAPRYCAIILGCPLLNVLCVVLRAVLVRWTRHHCRVVRLARPLLCGTGSDRVTNRVFLCTVLPRIHAGVCVHHCCVLQLRPTLCRCFVLAGVIAVRQCRVPCGLCCRLCRLNNGTRTPRNHVVRAAARGS